MKLSKPDFRAALAGSRDFLPNTLFNENFLSNSFSTKLIVKIIKIIFYSKFGFKGGVPLGEL